MSDSKKNNIFYCKKNKTKFESGEYEIKMSKNNKQYALCKCNQPECKANHVCFLKKSSIENIPEKILSSSDESKKSKNKKNKVVPVPVSIENKEIEKIPKKNKSKRKNAAVNEEIVA